MKKHFMKNTKSNEWDGCCLKNDFVVYSNIITLRNHYHLFSLKGVCGDIVKKCEMKIDTL